MGGAKSPEAKSPGLQSRKTRITPLAQTKDTELTAEKQPPNGFAPIPSELFGQLCQLSHVDRSVFLMLCMKANRDWEPRGVLRYNITNVAMWCSTSPGCVRRALKNLDAAGLIEYFRGGIRVIHYKDGKCTQVDHSDPHPDQADPPSDQSDPLTGSHGSTISTQPLQSSSFVRPLDGIDGSKDGSEDVAAAEKKPRKAPRKRVKPWLYWDAELEQLRCHKDDPRYSAFMARWTERLGNEERVVDEYYKAEAWLIRYPEKRAKTKSFERFLGNWLGKEE